ncbi:7-deoxyloganetin glucosyltransferase [Ricinus communis]|uniref:7-deoxyloganetin glucosyltransferase n=1 Tax=Ricinus communis TaxID=3988 RepID=UPI00201AA288|nr:7-deoxyloganetin glucosyltransferase [Ricinus communis]
MQAKQKERQMGSLCPENLPPHAVCVPFPAQGHINPMLKLAKLLHQKGFHITFVNTEYNHQRLLKSRGPDSLNGLPSFRFETIPDGLPSSENANSTQDVPSLCYSTKRNCLAPFRYLLSKLNNSASSNVPPVTCIVFDCIMSFTLQAGQELGVPVVLFWTASVCGFMAYLHYRPLVEKGFVPLKDASYLTNGYLDTLINWIPGMEGIRLKNLPSFIRTTDPDDIMVNFAIGEVENARNASAVIFNTFDDLEYEVLTHLCSILPNPILTIGPLQLLLQDQVQESVVNSIKSNLWEEQPGCLEWLDSKEPNSVIYVNFGSVTVMTPQQLVEFAWGLANNKKTFLWVIRPDLVTGESAIIPPEFLKETKERGLLANWCPQEEVLMHPSIGGFLTHSGWNSTIESLAGGVPMICWPFFAEQQTNSWFCCNKWCIGMEIDNDANRTEIERLVKELMNSKPGSEVKNKAMEWKMKAEEATSRTGSSYMNLDKMITMVLH